MDEGLVMSNSVEDLDNTLDDVAFLYHRLGRRGTAHQRQRFVSRVARIQQLLRDIGRDVGLGAFRIDGPGYATLSLVARALSGRDEPLARLLEDRLRLRWA
jgi:hypothetical protein